MKRILTTALGAIAVTAAAVWWFALRAPEPAMAQTAEPVADASGTSEQFGVTEMTMGEEDAPVEVIEYGSFTCPHCARFHTDVLPEIEENYIDTGEVKFTFREVYFDKYGMWASLIARCDGGTDRFFGLADMFYSTQSEWVRAGSEGAIADELRKIGRIAGLDSDKIDACLSDGDKLQSLLEWYQANAEAHDITATPSFVIDGEKYSNMPYDDFAEVLDSKLGE